MGKKNETSGLGLALKLITVSLASESKNNRTIRNGVIKLLEKKMQEVTFIATEEIPHLLEQLQEIEQHEPKVADEVKQLIEKFHPNL